MHVKAEKEVNCETAIHFGCWDGLWHSAGGSGVPPHTRLGQGQLWTGRAKIRNPSLVLTPSHVFCASMGFNTYTETHKHKTRQNVTARSTSDLVYWPLSNTSSKKSSATHTKQPEKPLLALTKTASLLIFFYMIHCNGYLCLKLLYCNYENKDFF